MRALFVIGTALLIASDAWAASPIGLAKTRFGLAAPSVVTASKESEWQTRRCRCTRSDRRGCVHWSCRRV